MVLRIAGRRLYLWRAVDHEDEILELLIQHRRDKLAAVRLMRKLLMKQGFVPKLAVTDKLRSYATAFQAFGLTCRHEQRLRMNNRAENSHLVVRRRERKMRDGVANSGNLLLRRRARTWPGGSAGRDAPGSSTSRFAVSTSSFTRCSQIVVWNTLHTVG
jgi:hypothetical protein